MKSKSTVVLLVLVVIAAVVAFSLSRKPTSEELAQQAKRVLAGMEADRVAVVEIAREGRRIVCERSDSDARKWRITQPLSLRADRWEVQGIIDRFETAESKGRPIPAAEAGAMADYGLDVPAATVTFRLAGPLTQSWTLLIGKETGVADTVFAAPADKSRIFTLGKAVADRLDVDVAELRSKRLVDDIDADALTAVRLKAAAWDDAAPFEVSCAREGAGWEMRAPLLEPADGDKITGLAGKVDLHRLSKGDFVSDDPTEAARYGLDEPALSVTLTLEDGELEFAFGRVEQEDGGETFYAMNKAEPAIVKVTRELFKDLRKAPGELRSRALAEFPKDKVRKLTIAHAGEQLVLRQQDGAWTIAGEPPAPADEGAVEDLLDGLGDAQVKEFVEDRPADVGRYGLGEADLWDVALADEKDEVLARVQLGGDDEQGEAAHARRYGYAAVLSVARDDYLADLRRGRLALLDRTVLSEDQSAAVRVAVTQGGRTQRCERKDRNDSWRLVEPVEGRADQFAVGDLVRTFSGLSAVGLAAESAEDLAPYGLDKPAAVVEVTYVPEAEGEGEEPAPVTRRLSVGAHTDGPAEGLFAMLEGRKGVVVLDGMDADDLLGEMGSRLISDLRDLQRMELKVADRSVVFLRDAQTRAWTGEGGEALNEEVRPKVEVAASLLSYWRGERIAAYSGAEPAKWGLDAPVLTVVLKDADAADKRVLVGKPAGEEGHFVRGPATSFVTVAGPEDVRKLMDVVLPAPPPQEGEAGGGAEAD